MTLEEVTRIWNALEQPYQLCISYEVTVPLIDSDIVDQHTPVADVIPDYAIVDTTTSPNERYPGKIVAAGFFGEKWELLSESGR